MDAADQAALDRALIALDGTPQKEPARRQCAGRGIDGRAARRRRGARQSRSMPICSATRAEAVMPLPEIQIFGGGAHAGRRVDIQDFMVVAPLATSFDQALEWTAEVYRAAGDLMAERGLLQGVADEGGFWPAFETNEAALDALVRAIERAGFTPGREIAISLDIAASEFHDGEPLPAGARRTPNSIRTAWPRC